MHIQLERAQSIETTTDRWTKPRSDSMQTTSRKSKRRCLKEKGEKKQGNINLSMQCLSHTHNASYLLSSTTRVSVASVDSSSIALLSSSSKWIWTNDHLPFCLLRNKHSQYNAIIIRVVQGGGRVNFNQLLYTQFVNATEDKLHYTGNSCIRIYWNNRLFCY